jgi:FtsP/CotA-like multicopper oxidase with cupredoxin domain
MPRAAKFVFTAPFVLLFAATALRSAPDPVAPNDNRHAAGVLANGVLTVSLDARTGVWHPEGEMGAGLTVAAFAEVGKPMSTPGPLIRVRAGTAVRGTIRNSLDQPLIIRGLGATRGMADSLVVPVNGSGAFQFVATTPGTYYYVGKRPRIDFGLRAEGDQQLNGAIIVDPANAAAAPNDRVLVISWNGGVDTANKTGITQFTMTINGLSWPHTERLDYTQGDSVHWRVINLTESDHPMHLHGFYFRADAKGDGNTDTVYTAAQQRMAVTEVIDPFQTLALSWKAERAGNWIYHCHYAVHLSNYVALDSKDGAMDMAMEEHHKSDAPHQMFGLVMGIRVAPRGPVVAAAARPRAIRIFVREKENFYGSQPGFAFVVAGTPDEVNKDAMPVPGAPLVLVRGEPVAITIVNQSSDHATIHWHGIELESYPDGVPGWSGAGANILPALAPGDSITVRFTPPRAGTFMYHSHFSEVKQIGGGAYGPIIVLEPGQKFDPATDKVLFFGATGSSTNVIFGPFASFVMNGQTQPAAMDLKAGTRYRFRLLNLAGDVPLIVGLSAGNVPVSWRAVAKDGYPLPDVQATTRPANLMFDPGEIYDFEYTPAARGELALTFGPPPPPPGSPPPPPKFSPPPPTITVPVHVN